MRYLPCRGLLGCQRPIKLHYPDANRQSWYTPSFTDSAFPKQAYGKFGSRPVTSPSTDLKPSALSVSPKASSPKATLTDFLCRPDQRGWKTGLILRPEFSQERGIEILIEQPTIFPPGSVFPHNFHPGPGLTQNPGPDAKLRMPQVFFSWNRWSCIWPGKKACCGSIDQTINVSNENNLLISVMI